jgi:hypothetical protein
MKLVLMLFIISLVGLAIFYLVDFFDESLNLAPPLVLIMVIVILGLVMTWGSVIPRVPI